jgi:hypothetical protein
MAMKHYYSAGSIQKLNLVTKEVRSPTIDLTQGFQELLFWLTRFSPTGFLFHRKLQASYYLVKLSTLMLLSSRIVKSVFIVSTSSKVT